MSDTNARNQTGEEFVNDSEEVVRVTSKRTTAQMLLKRTVQLFFRLVVVPRVLLCRVASKLSGAQAFIGASESIARVPGLRGVYLRQAFYAATLKSCGEDVYFGWNSTFSMTEARVADRVYIGQFCNIGFAEIGEEAMLANSVIVLSGGHEHRNDDSKGTLHQGDQMYRRVRIGRGAWIGASAVVMADVGKGAIVGAGAVVTRAIPDHCVAAGVPARVIKSHAGAVNESIS